MKRYKYIHFLWANETKFNEPIAKIVNQKELNPELSLIVTPHPDLYEKLKKYGNISLDESKCNLFNKYYKHCEWMISHGYPQSYKRYLLYPWVKKKIIYRYWGGRRVFYFKDSSHFLYNFYLGCYKQIYEALYRSHYDGMALIGTAGLVDEIDLGHIIKKTKMMTMPYGYGSDPSIFDISSRKRTDGIIRIVIGHRSDRIFKHIFYINLLRKFDQEKIEIHIPIAYGDNKYAKELKDYVSKNKINNVFFLEKYIPRYPDYFEYLNSMDIALFDCDNSIATGNIITLLNLGKTIYLSRNGVFKKAFDHESIPYHCLDEINTMSFEQFASLLKIDRDSLGRFKAPTFSEYVQSWQDIYLYLDSLKATSIHK